MHACNYKIVNSTHIASVYQYINGHHTFGRPLALRELIEIIYTEDD